MARGQKPEKLTPLLEITSLNLGQIWRLSISSDTHKLCFVGSCLGLLYDV